MQTDIFDVIQIGYGPVSQTLAQILGNQGRRVAVVERWKQRYPLPRAVCVDHELYRVLSAIGLGDVLPSVTQPGPIYQWFNADWRELLCIDWSAPSISGGPGVNFVHQPTLEEALDRAVSAQSTVDVQLGWEAVEIVQDEEGVTVHLRHVDSNEEKTLRGRYVIGCDGANSLARQTIGGEREDRGFEADWLVIDVLLKEGVTADTLGIPPAGQYCNPAQPTTIVPAGIRGDRTFRRWEFMRLPGVSVEEMEREERVWELLKPWAGPDKVELVRHKVYNFRSLMASQWRDRRVLIAGDAAHVMPPFMGQGMCSGMRDAWNLGWKLDLILDGKADDRLLDSYQTERLPHVSQLIDMSIFLGKVICIPDADKAAERDRAFADGTHPAFPDFPHLSDGLLLRQADGSLAAGAGLLSPHDLIGAGASQTRLDSFTNGGFVLVSRDGDGLSVCTTAQQDALDALGVSQVVVGAHGLPDGAGRITQFLQEQGWAAMLVRPDFYIYGGVDSIDAVPTLIGSLLTDLETNGVSLAAVQPGTEHMEYHS